ncbi:uncharacterized protein LTR77_003311 [Saxophila tyrrhenica]|uniref:GS catalytic domain-containing protein n=1 Tax=Saxophila tyrrhenica TaxID=1690608 RepID=A0AAV9PH07_9PEZI|nr:hypothetical protein LTR77_003311 [Saxophila tyrrhenica]
MTTTNSLHELKQLIRACPVIDNHAHNLLRPHGQKTSDLLTITTEASGEALEDTPTSLAHLRAVRQLRKLYDLPADADWAAILKKRAELLDGDADALYKKCFEGTQTILVDDGLATADAVEPYSFHDKYTLSPCKRIVRIETVAADILSALYQQNKLPAGVALADEEACSLAWLAFITAFEEAVAALLGDSEVVGFKSVICYRTGLDIRPRRDVEITEDGLRSFRRHYLPECVSRNFRVEAKGMNDALVISTCKLIAAGYRQQGVAKPLQFHTGLGDNDINLLDANPACLQPLIAHFPTVPVVLLHSSYPYTREAGYLATVYKNCYLDIGEVFPMVSRDGQEKIVRQALELTPWSKLLLSTDGHFFPDTYWLANVQGREAIERVMCEYVEKEDLEVKDAMKAVKDVFFENSNKLYDLRLKMEDGGKELPNRPKEDQASAEEASGSSHGMALQPTSRYAKAYREVFLPFTRTNPLIHYVFVQWLDYMATLRTRCLPISEFSKMLKVDSTIRMTYGNLGTLQNDHMSSVCNPVGSISVEPDITLASLRRMQSIGPVKNSATVMARFTDDAGLSLGPCPRAQLGELVSEFQRDRGVAFLVGFEIEVTFCKRLWPSELDQAAFAPLDTAHAWGTFTDEQYMTSFELMLNVTRELRNTGIEVQQMHSEAGDGQYEFVLPPLPPVEAVDTLIQARQCIQQVAASRGLRATCHPQPFPGIGTAAHAHISFNRSTEATDREDVDLDRTQMSFMASVLEHLPSLCAITMPQAVSYGRVLDDSWTGGTWVAWGTENREVPLRKSDKLRWEVRCLDGCANMYLALTAIFAAGLAGVRSGKEVAMKDCLKNPTQLSPAEKEDLGITKKLPTTIAEAVEAAENDSELERAMPDGMLKHFLAMKKDEQKMLNEMDDGARRVWLMERY